MSERFGICKSCVGTGIKSDSLECMSCFGSGSSGNAIDYLQMQADLNERLDRWNEPNESQYKNWGGVDFGMY